MIPQGSEALLDPASCVQVAAEEVEREEGCEAEEERPLYDDAGLGRG